MNIHSRRGSLAAASLLSLVVTTATPAATSLLAAQPSSPRGLPACTDPLTDFDRWHIAAPALPALESAALPGSPRVVENVIPTTANPLRICWLGHYAGRVIPAAADESFLIRIFPDSLGLPVTQMGPIFTRTFSQSGTAGIDRLEMGCLNGQNCPGSTDPDAGGHWVYSAELDGGFPMAAGACYWIEVSNIGSAAQGVTWLWSASHAGVDLRTLQGADGGYTICDPIDYDRAIALSGGVSPMLGACSDIPIPTPVCQFDSVNGQPPVPACDNTLPRRYSRSSSPGSTGGPTWTAALLADDFGFDQDRTISGLCFFGQWICPSGDGPCDPPTPSAAATWDIAYHADAEGVPGDAIASFRVGATPGVTLLWDGHGVAHVEHPPVSLRGGECYWLSIGRLQHGDGAESQWAWAHTTPGHAGDGAFATNVGGVWHRTHLPGDDGAILSNLAFLLSAGPTASPACGPRDCNANGIPDADEVAGDPTLDCFNPAGPPGILGRPDGTLDACQCIADWNGDGAVNSTDIGAYLDTWLASSTSGNATDADVDCSGDTTGADITAFLARWQAAAGVPTPSCP